MAELIVHNPPRAALKASGYIGSPEGDIELTENDTTYNVADFATATTRIPKPPEPTGTKEIIENGVHDVKQYAFADVKIPEPSGTIALDENNRSYDVTDYATADVAIPEEEKTVMPSTTRQEVTPDNGLLSKVTVLPASLEERTVTPTIVQQTITPEAPAIGLSKVTVGAALPPPILVSKQITANGTYAAADDNADGYSDVTVNIQPYYNSQGTMYFADMVIPDTVTAIKTSAYQSCINLQTLEIAGTVKTVGTYAFQNCQITSLVLTYGIENVQGFAFAGNKCDEIIFPSTIKKIDGVASFAGKVHAVMDLSVFTDPNNIPILGNSRSFYVELNNTFLVANQLMLEAFEAATNWSTYAGKYVIKGATS